MVRPGLWFRPGWSQPVCLLSAGVIGGDRGLHPALQHRGPAGVEPGSAGGGRVHRGNPDPVTPTRTPRLALTSALGCV